jgi:hypothetical protein
MLLTVAGAWLVAADGAGEPAPPLDADGLAVELPQAAAIKPMTATIVAGLLSLMSTLLLVIYASTDEPWSARGASWRCRIGRPPFSP